MKNIILLVFLTSFIIGCGSSKLNKSIPYLLPDSVESKLYNVIKDEPEYNFAFYLIHEKDDIYKIIMLRNKQKDYKAIDSFDYIKKSNRKVFINNKFYPLVFRSDYIFGTDMRKTELITLSEREEREKKYRSDRKAPESPLFLVHRSWLNAEGYSITFDKKGNIIEE
jgi:DNA-binding LytR/AlgR family response regulator